MLVVTGSRAEFGLLTPVMAAVRAHPRLELLVAAAGSHLLPPARTVREVEAAFGVDARVRMQRPGERRTRLSDARAVARGIDGLARVYARLKPDWVVVLGDRIEAFAAASAASIAGIAVCHIHGGDRAEGIADEAMRHAITKLSHLHCAATELSAERIRRMGERPERVHVTGSPAIDGLSDIEPMSDAEAAGLGDPAAVVLLHPAGLPESEERDWALHAFGAASLFGAAPAGRRVLILSPNADAGRGAIARVWRGAPGAGGLVIDHLPRRTFVALLKRLRRMSGVLIGNSSAGLIEAAALGVRTLNLGPRQAGRERGANVVDVATPDRRSMLRGLEQIQKLRPRPDPRFGDGRAGPRIAALLAKTDPRDPALLRKRNVY